MMPGYRMQHFLNLRPLPQGQGSLRPTRCDGRWIVAGRCGGGEGLAFGFSEANFSN